MIQYVHTDDVHTLDGAKSGFAGVFGETIPTSLLDVGCGTGTWLQVALDAGVKTVVGVDGVTDGSEFTDVAGAEFVRHDLTQPLDLQRQFDVVISLEVAEHLSAEHAPVFIATLCRHADIIYFSAACPGQHGQHHVNCKWPDYWQALFNAEGFVCTDEPRTKIWSRQDIQPWYRQNIFKCVRDPKAAGKEARLDARIHPDMLTYMNLMPVSDIEQAKLPLHWYVNTTVGAVKRKVARALGAGK